MRIRLRWVAAALLLCAMTPLRSGGAVAVERKPPVVEHKTFDPANRPAEMPPLKGTEVAITQSQFECGVGVTYQVISRKQKSDGCKVSLKVRGITATLQLKIVIWVPEGVTPKVVAHEEGHRQIVERVYQQAEKVARTIAKSLDGKAVTGEGSDCQAADKQANQSIASKFCESYLDQTARPSARINEIYDDLTAHGTKTEPAEDEAIRQAFEKAKAQ
jgi:hypothetical protein